MTIEEQLHTALTTSFRFVVHIDDKAVGAFTECTLPTIEWEMLTIKEGGLNTSVHQRPGQRKESTLTLKNGIGIVDDLLSWCTDAMNEKFKRRKVTVTMHNPFQEALITWRIEDALVKRWSAPQLQADSNTVAIQTLELVCGEVTVMKGNGGS
jgi:phage tail-like protein